MALGQVIISNDSFLKSKMYVLLNTKSLNAFNI